MNSEHHRVIILNGRPAAGKSEVIDYLKKTPLEERLRRFRIGDFEEIDDFRYVWQSFEEDDILSKHGRPRVWTTPDYYFKDHFIWNLYIEKINLAFEKRLREQPDFLNRKTAIIEFSRGGENGFAEAYGYLSEGILKEAGIVYIKVSYEESVRKNRRRKRPDQLDSILFHSLPDAKMERYYKTNDWETFEKTHSSCITVKGISIPYAIFPNEPEVTDKPELLGRTLETTLTTLWERRRNVEKG